MNTDVIETRKVHNDAFSDIHHLICDSHVHVGSFRNGATFSPREVHAGLKELDIRKWAVSSMTGECDGFESASRSITVIMELAPEQTIPILWVTPEMIDASEDLESYGAIRFFGLKIHGYMNKWSENPDSMEKVFEAAMRRHMPIILHTGETPESEAGIFGEYCGRFKDLKVILAHGRPIEQAIRVMKENPNAYVDTAFLPLEDVSLLNSSIGSDRILFGTDFPLDQHYYPGESSIVRYRRRINELVAVFGEELIVMWANRNFNEIFALPSDT